MKKCPRCGGTRFDVTAHVTQDWVVDENGNFMRELDTCSAVLHMPDDDDLWECHECGYEASGREFNVVKTIEKQNDGYTCPVCGAVLQTFDATEDSYGVMYIPWLCNHCHNSGRSRFEHSGWNFVEYELDVKE